MQKHIINCRHIQQLLLRMYVSVVSKVLYVHTYLQVNSMCIDKMSLPLVACSSFLELSPSLALNLVQHPVLLVNHHYSKDTYVGMYVSAYHKSELSL